MSKPMSKQMQKLADRYEKATGKKFNAQTNAQKIRAMSDEELAKLLCCTGWRMFEYKECLEWLKKPAKEYPELFKCDISETVESCEECGFCKVKADKETLNEQDCRH